MRGQLWILELLGDELIDQVLFKQWTRVHLPLESTIVLSKSSVPLRHLIGIPCVIVCGVGELLFDCFFLFNSWRVELGVIVNRVNELHEGGQLLLLNESILHFLLSLHEFSVKVLLAHSQERIVVNSVSQHLEFLLVQLLLHFLPSCSFLLIILLVQIAVDGTELSVQLSRGKHPVARCDKLSCIRGSKRRLHGRELTC